MEVEYSDDQCKQFFKDFVRGSLHIDLADKKSIENIYQNLDSVIKKSTGLPVSIAEDPLNSVVLGCGQCLDNLDKVKNLLTSAY